MKEIDHDPDEPRHGTPSLLSVVSYLIAAAILLPVGWWLKSTGLFGLGNWIDSFFQ